MRQAENGHSKIYPHHHPLNPEMLFYSPEKDIADVI
jgi:hypothetical protein